MFYHDRNDAHLFSFNLFLDNSLREEDVHDLIFIDLIMPEMNGYDSARKILAFDKTVLIVAFTADNMPDARRKAELSGIREFIAKPVRIEELKKLFAKYFSKSQP